MIHEMHADNDRLKEYWYFNTTGKVCFTEF